MREIKKGNSEQAAQVSDTTEDDKYYKSLLQKMFQNPFDVFMKDGSGYSG